MNTYNKHPKAVNRRKNALLQLKTQLRANTKRVESDTIVELSEADKKRINNEITKLNERI